MKLSNSTYSDNVANFETFISKNESFETLSETTVLTDVPLKTFNSVIPDDEPQFESTETTAQRDTPVLL